MASHDCAREQRKKAEPNSAKSREAEFRLEVEGEALTGWPPPSGRTDATDGYANVSPMASCQQ